MIRKTLQLTGLTIVALLALMVAVNGQAAQGNTPLPTPETAAAELAASPRHGEWFNVRSGTEIVRTYIVHPVRKDRGPCVIVVAEGLDDWARAIGHRLADEGFTALVADLSTDSAMMGRRPSPADVGQGLRTLKAPVLTARMQSVFDYAIRLPAVNEKVATIGFGWGGVPAIAYAAAQPAITATVIVYGTQPSASDLAKIKSPVLGFYAASDGRTPANLDLVQQNWARTVDFLKQQTK
jgi:carboxymethylenebutenolidase